MQRPVSFCSLGKNSWNATKFNGSPLTLTLAADPTRIFHWHSRETRSLPARKHSTPSSSSATSLCPCAYNKHAGAVFYLEALLFRQRFKILIILCCCFDCSRSKEWRFLLDKEMLHSCSFGSSQDWLVLDVSGTEDCTLRNLRPIK